MFYGRLAATLFILVFAIEPGLSFGEDSPAPTHSAEIRKDLNKVKIYLENIKTLKGSFLQVSSDTEVRTGKFFISRPGRIRFEYDPPEPILIISDGLFLVYIDKYLEQTTHVLLKATPLNFFLREKISFENDIRLDSIEKSSGVLTIVVRDARSPEKGSLALIFYDSPLEQKKWEFIDAQDIKTTVTLSNVEDGVVLEPDLFNAPDFNKMD
ncbi:MAG: outer-membrane lipoprotein carrier protein LolA [Pseudomonadota bacterium]|nr:outer-membrane lipoprotein carrier protein LolA [Pseudomonadota bacterium]